MVTSLAVCFIAGHLIGIRSIRPRCEKCPLQRTPDRSLIAKSRTTQSQAL